MAKAEQELVTKQVAASIPAVSKQFARKFILVIFVPRSKVGVFEVSKVSSGVLLKVDIAILGTKLV